MKDDRKKFQEFAELAGRRKEHLLHRHGQRSKPEGQVGQVYSIPIPVARVAELGYAARARGEAPGAYFDSGGSDVWMRRLSGPSVGIGLTNHVASLWKLVEIST